MKYAMLWFDGEHLTTVENAEYYGGLTEVADEYIARANGQRNYPATRKSAAHVFLLKDKDGVEALRRKVAKDDVAFVVRYDGSTVMYDPPKTKKVRPTP